MDCTVACTHMYGTCTCTTYIHVMYNINLKKKLLHITLLLLYYYFFKNNYFLLLLFIINYFYKFIKL